MKIHPSTTQDTEAIRLQGCKRNQRIGIPKGTPIRGLRESGMGYQFEALVYGHWGSYWSQTSPLAEETGR